MIAQIRPQSQEDIDRREKKFKLYDYYGIPHSIFDEIDIPKKVEKDWSEAVALIMSEKNIPEDLEKRLLEYKRKFKEMTGINNKL